MDDDTLAASDVVEAGLIRALELLDRALEGRPEDQVRELVARARREVDDVAALVPAIGRVSLRP